MARAKRHIHKYHKINLAHQMVWACALPDCSHYMPKHMEAMINGKASICWSCGNEFILNPSNMTNDRPECDSCRLGITTENIDDLISRISNS